MLSITECKKIIRAKEKEITDEQINKIIELFYYWAKIEFNNYKKLNNEKASNNLFKSVHG